jgi:hypothetical protein
MGPRQQCRGLFYVWVTGAGHCGVMWWFAFLLLPGLAAAQPARNAQREGQVACMAGRLCACRYETGGSLTGRPSAHRWDCGALRPDCRPDPLPGPDNSALPWLAVPPRAMARPPKPP